MKGVLIMYENSFNLLEISESLVDNCYKIKKVFDERNNLKMVQVLNSQCRIYKCLFYDENKRLSNISMYDTDSGKEVRNFTFRADGKTLSSMREYAEGNRLASVTFFKEDGKSPSSTIEYDAFGRETQFSIYNDDGEIITQKF